MTRRNWLRAGALGLAAVAVVVGLTFYFSTEATPPCFVSGIPKWKAPSDGETHQYVVAFPNGAACFFDRDEGLNLVGALRADDVPPYLRHAAARGPSASVKNLPDVEAIRRSRIVIELDWVDGKPVFPR